MVKQVNSISKIKNTDKIIFGEKLSHWFNSVASFSPDTEAQNDVTNTVQIIIYFSCKGTLLLIPSISKFLLASILASKQWIHCNEKNLCHEKGKFIAFIGCQENDDFFNLSFYCWLIGNNNSIYYST